MYDPNIPSGEIKAIIHNIICTKYDLEQKLREADIQQSVWQDQLDRRNELFG